MKISETENSHTFPEWFLVSEQLMPQIAKRLSFALSNLEKPIAVRLIPLQAYWHLSNVLFIANTANREGMHANAISITRQCIECISIIELGLSQHPNSTDLLMRWSEDKIKPGEIRAWLAKNLWPDYGNGLWSESWENYMTSLAKALQPYAHYAAPLSQWYGRVHDFKQPVEGGDYLATLEIGPRIYDPQKATRITLFHALLTFTLSRIWSNHLGQKDHEFNSLLESARIAIGASPYLDGDGTNWEQQFWAFLWFRDGNPE